MIAAVYGLQALVFIMRRKWDMIGWMLFYVLAIPAFSFFLPLYSFWRMDDFSWGQTRVVLGESGKKMIVHVSVALVSCRNKDSHCFQDEGKFDPRSIPLKSWNDYVSVLWIAFYNNLMCLFRKMNSGTKSLIIVLDHGYLRQR
jgi:chitin synthase